MGKSDKLLRIFLWFFMLVGGVVGGFFLDALWFPSLFTNILFHGIMFLLGLAASRLVINAAKNTGRYLNKNGRVGDIPRLETNRLVTTGYYRCMRHPMHLGLLFFPFAVALLAGSPSFFLVIAPLEALLMILLIKTVEEPQAEKKFGAEYREYMLNTPMFSFKRDCLKLLFGKDGYLKVN